MNLSEKRDGALAVRKYALDIFSEGVRWSNGRNAFHSSPQNYVPNATKERKTT